MTFKTTNIDLAASLITHGVPLSDVVSLDGVICEFVFPDHWGPGFEYTTEITARVFESGTLMVNALGVTQRLRELRIAIRRAQDSYRKNARAEAGIQS